MHYGSLFITSRSQLASADQTVVIAKKKRYPYHRSTSRTYQRYLTYITLCADDVQTHGDELLRARDIDK